MEGGCHPIASVQLLDSTLTYDFQIPKTELTKPHLHNKPARHLHNTNMTSTGTYNSGNFANRPTEEVQELGRKGGLAAHGIVENPTNSTENSNPGNFANRPHDEVVDAARKGGLASKGGVEEVAAGNGNPGNFANRPHEEVVNAASKGGKASAIV